MRLEVICTLVYGEELCALLPYIYTHITHKRGEQNDPSQCVHYLDIISEPLGL